MKQETVKFIAKVEQLFNLGKVSIIEFEHLMREWEKLISMSCYVENNVKQTHINLNQQKLIIKWAKKQYSPGTINQLQDYFQCMIQYVNVELQSLSLHAEIQGNVQGTKETPEKSFYWTTSKRSLIELISALDSAKCINKGNISTQRIVEHFEEMFDVDLTNYHSEISKMASRKPVNDSDNRAYFLNDLAELFNSKMLKIQ